MTALSCQPAHAYSIKDGCEEGAYRGNNVQYVFSSDSRWNSSSNSGWNGATPKQVAASGFGVWALARNRDATPIVKMSATAQTGSRAVSVRLVGYPGGDPFLLGAFSCDSGVNVLELNEIMIESYPSSTEFYETATHEMGHGISLHHTGSTDSHVPYDTPLMSPTGSGIFYGLDDAAVVSHHYAIGANDTFTANYGFENGLDWYTWSGAPVTLTTGSTSGGVYHATVVPNSSGDNLNQSVAVMNATGRWVRPSMQYVTPGATSGGVRLQLYQRDVKYEYDNSAENQNLKFPLRDRNMDVRTSGVVESAYYVVRSESFPISNSWRTALTSQHQIPPILDSSSRVAGGVDLRLRVFSTASVAGEYIHVHYDDVRIQEG
jgi:hypothetical protein